MTTSPPNLPATQPGLDLMAACTAVARSGLGGIKTPEQALTLAAIALADDQDAADGPVAMLRALGKASRDFHIISGKAALKSDAMLARFLSAGGTVQWSAYTDTKCEATFSHPRGGSVCVEWSIERARQAGLLKPGPWQTHPRAMLRARVISEAIRTVFPGVLSGLYSEDEVREIVSQDATQRPDTAPSLDDMAKAKCEADRKAAREAYQRLADEGHKEDADRLRAESGGLPLAFLAAVERYYQTTNHAPIVINDDERTANENEEQKQ